MSSPTIHLWFIGVALAALSAVLAVVYRNPEFTKAQIYWKGSFLYRNLDKYVRPRYVIAVRILAYGGIFFCLVALVLLFAEEFW